MSSGSIYYKRAAVMILLVIPVIALGAAVVDWLGSSYRPRFLDVLASDILVGYLYGFVPSVLTSLAHTRITRARPPAARFRRAISGLVGAAVGGIAGLALGFLVAVLSILSDVLVVLLLWGAFAGALYGFAVGPASYVEHELAHQ